MGGFLLNTYVSDLLPFTDEAVAMRIFDSQIHLITDRYYQIFDLKGQLTRLENSSGPDNGFYNITVGCGQVLEGRNVHRSAQLIFSMNSTVLS